MPSKNVLTSLILFSLLVLTWPAAGDLCWQRFDAGLTASPYGLIASAMAPPLESVSEAEDAPTLYVLTRSGLWRKSGQRWRNVLPHRYCDGGSVSVDPRDPARVVVSTPGELWVSEDSGETWSSSNFWDFTLGRPTYFYSIAFDPSLPATVLAAGMFTIQGTTSPLLFSSDDGGVTWESAEVPGQRLPVQPRLVAFDPHLVGQVYLGGHSGFFRSSDTRTWEFLLGDEELVTQDIPQLSFEDIAFTEQPGTFFVASQKGLWRTRDFGDHFELLTLPDGVFGFGGTAWNVEFDAGTGTLYVSTGVGILRSTDEGASFETLGGPTGKVRLLLDARRQVLYAHDQISGFSGSVETALHVLALEQETCPAPMRASRRETRARWSP